MIVRKSLAILAMAFSLVGSSLTVFALPVVKNNSDGCLYLKKTIWQGNLVIFNYKKGDGTMTVKINDVYPSSQPGKYNISGYIAYKLSKNEAVHYEEINQVSSCETVFNPKLDFYTNAAYFHATMLSLNSISMSALINDSQGKKYHGSVELELQ